MTQITDDPRLYVRITADLRHKISTGRIQADTTVSITTLCQQWQACRQTVSRALRTLEDDSLIRRYPGIGYYVLTRPAPAPAGTETTRA
jgi:DNA-binding GntR family transcriptional regulator